MSVPHVLAGFVALELNKINITNVGATIFGWIRGTWFLKNEIAPVGATIYGRICGTNICNDVY